MEIPKKSPRVLNLSFNVPTSRVVIFTKEQNKQIKA